MPRKYNKRQPEFPTDGKADAPEIDFSGAPITEDPLQPPPAPVVIAPPPPNPAVIALQEDIVRLVRSRAEIRMRVHQAHAQLLHAQNQFQIAQSEMKGVEEEVNYLHSQCAQLEGRRETPPMIGYTTSPDNLTIMPGASLSGISSEPTMPQVPRSYAPADGVNRAHAVREVL